MKLSIKSMHLVVISAWGSRVIAACSMIYSLRVLSKELNSPEYAAFIIFVGLIGWFALADFGLGYAVQNTVTRKLAQGGIASVEILAAYFILLASAILVILLLFIFKSPLTDLLFSKITENGGLISTNTFVAAASLLALGGVATISSKILYAVHRGYIANITTALGSLVGVAVLMVGVESATDKILFAVVALYGPNIIINLAFCIHQSLRAYQHRLSISWRTASNLFNSARGFFLFYFMAAAVLQIDYLIMSQKIPAEEIIQYFTVAKIFSFVSFINQAVLMAAWPYMTGIYSNGDRTEINRIIGRLVLGGIFVAVVATIFVLFFRVSISNFLAPGIESEFRASVILGFGAIALLRSITDPYAIFLQSIDVMRPLIFFVAAQALIGGGLQWLLADSLGIEGILLAILLSFVLTVTWGLPLITNRTLKLS